MQPCKQAIVMELLRMLHGHCMHAASSANQVKNKGCSIAVQIADADMRKHSKAASKVHAIHTRECRICSLGCRQWSRYKKQYAACAEQHGGRLCSQYSVRIDITSMRGSNPTKIHLQTCHKLYSKARLSTYCTNLGRRSSPGSLVRPPQPRG